MRQNTWLINSTKNLLPLSQSQSFLEAIKSEWFFEGRAIDLGTPSADCQLCNHEAIRYQFEIHNQLTDNKLLIGSSCIKRFGIKYKSSDGTTYTMDATMYEVNQARKDAIQARLILCKEKVLDDLVLLRKNITDSNVDVQSFIDNYNRFSAFTPKQLAFVTSLLEQYHILYDISNYVVATRTYQQQSDINTLNDLQYNRIVGALSLKQRKYRLRKAA
jgi:hypothetical protein